MERCLDPPYAGWPSSQGPKCSRHALASGFCGSEIQRHKQLQKIIRCFNSNRQSYGRHSAKFFVLGILLSPKCDSAMADRDVALRQPSGLTAYRPLLGFADFTLAEPLNCMGRSFLHILHSALEMPPVLTARVASKVTIRTPVCAQRPYRWACGCMSPVPARLQTSGASFCGLTPTCQPEIFSGNRPLAARGCCH
ncbi:hypothetical protein M011DRAFT_14555 [Sporormia fimetaria CBS 119925]|uniref:Uncharacterized protein n=1 Tax=Sporormia fimetaria CBS 119925 TaxID=1340428 RepID=A0A6A6VQ97_9PLEO|nr:hypothetical protein M011DRAFT_14555 [Sporormia fimetaria CBS 119925]